MIPSGPPACPVWNCGPQAGFGILESVIGLAILAIALLAYVSTSLSHQRLAEAMAARTEVHHVARNFMERLRGDAEWATLHERLSTLQVQANATGTTGPRLEDGRLGYSPSTYYADIQNPRDLGSLIVLVDVPYVESSSGERVLREDILDARFGLPADLNGDGTLDAEPHTDDYVALPVVVTFHWAHGGESPRELRFSTALRGER